MSAPDRAGPRAPLHGVLAVDKPAGPTSFEVVARVRRALGGVRAGHAGTLDPAATGLLAVCLGDALKVQRWLVEGDKAYDAVVAFGAATDTEDAEGRVTERGDPSALDAARIRAALPALLGEIRQVPPMFSAVRVGGRRLHAAARAGEEVARAPRAVRVHALELGAVEPGPAGLLLARLRVECGKGTYVRTLAADLGRTLGVPAHLAALRRTRASGLEVADAIGLDALEALAASDPGALRARVVPPAEALAPTMPAARLGAAEAVELVHGRPIADPAGSGPSPRPGPGELPLVRAVAPDGRLVAVCARVGGKLKPVRVLLAPGDLLPEGGGAGQDR
jgi:tRNA pseudouridine55 synthase